MDTHPELPTLIGIVGIRRSGKSEVASYLTQKYGYTRTRVAGPLKDMLRALGLTEEQVDGSEKETPCDILGGKSPRFAMQSLGTEWGRDMISPDFWLNAWKSRLRSDVLTVVDDIRFQNEADYIRERGGVLIRVTRPGFESDGHLSETGLSDYITDANIINSETLDSLYNSVDVCLAVLKSPPIVGNSSA